MTWIHLGSSPFTGTAAAAAAAAAAPQERLSRMQQAHQMRSVDQGTEVSREYFFFKSSSAHFDSASIHQASCLGQRAALNIFYF